MYIVKFDQNVEKVAMIQFLYRKIWSANTVTTASTLQ